MRALVFTDLQADEGSDRLRSDAGVPLQRWRVTHFYAQVKQLMQEYGCNQVWDLGDSTHDRNAIALPTLQAVSAGTRAITAGTDWLRNFRLVGNHEQFVKSTEVHGADIAQPYFRVASNNQLIHLREESLVFLLVPYPKDGVEAETEAWIKRSCLRAKSWGCKVILLGHFQCKGAMQRSGLSIKGIDIACAVQADIALLGHVHKHQRLAEKAWYIGSPFQQNFGESGEGKCVAIVDTDEMSVEFVPTTGFPAYRVISLADLAHNGITGEDRLRVELKNVADVERYYAMPESKHCEPVFLFEQQQAADRRESSTDPVDCLRKHVDLNPLNNYGISPDEVLKFGRDLARI